MYDDNCLFISILFYDNFTAKTALLHKSFFSLKRGSVIYRVFDYFMYRYFHVYYKFLYINRTFWKNMFIIKKFFMFFLESSRWNILD